MTMRTPGELDPATIAIGLLDRLDERDLPARLVDEAMQALAHHRRRLAIAVVREHDEAVSLPDVADEVAVREHGRPLQELSAETVAETYISLYHDHLPRLVDLGLLAYDQERDLVKPAY